MFLLLKIEELHINNIEDVNDDAVFMNGNQPSLCDENSLQESNNKSILKKQASLKRLECRFLNFTDKNWCILVDACPNLELADIKSFNS